MGSPYIELDGLLIRASNGGYNQTPKLRQLSGVFLLSACLVMRQRWLWQNPISPISDTTYNEIIEMIEQAESDLMTSQAIGSIIPTITYFIDSDYLPLDGSIVDGTLYPEFLSVAPAIWVTGTDVQLPDMSRKGLFGENGDVGTYIGENSVQLSVSELPSHTHIQNAHSHSYILTGAIPTAAGLEPTLADITTQALSTTGSAIATNQTTGNDELHNNIQESLCVYWFIKVR